MTRAQRHTILNASTAMAAISMVCRKRKRPPTDQEYVLTCMHARDIEKAVNSESWLSRLRKCVNL